MTSVKSICVRQAFGSNFDFAAVGVRLRAASSVAAQIRLCQAPLTLDTPLPAGV
jgi:hypothetical protein